MHCRILSVVVLLSSMLVFTSGCTRPNNKSDSTAAVIAGGAKPVDGIGFSGTDEAQKRAAAVWELLIKTLNQYSSVPDAFVSYTCPTSLLNDPDCILLARLSSDEAKRNALAAFVAEATVALNAIHNSVSSDKLISIVDGGLQVSDPVARTVDARTSRSPALMEMNRAAVLAAQPNVLGKIVGHEAGHLVRDIVDKSAYLVFDRGEDLLDYFGVVTSRLALEEKKIGDQTPQQLKWAGSSGRMVRYNGDVNNSVIDIFGLGADNRIKSNRRLKTLTTNGGWRGWDAVPGDFVSKSLGPIVRYAKGTNYDPIEVFVIGSDDHVYANVLMQDGSNSATNGWRGWQEIPSGFQVKMLGVEAAKYSGDVVEMFAIGADDKVYSNVRYTDGRNANTGGWRGWVLLGGNTKAMISIGGVAQYPVSGQNDSIEISGVGADGKVYTNWLARDGSYASTGGWRGWSTLGGNNAPGKAVGGVAQYAVSGSSDAIEIFSISAGNVVQNNLLDRTNGWGGFKDIGPNFLAASLGGIIQYPIGSGRSPNEISSVGMDNRLYTNTYLRDGSGWVGWTLVPDAAR